MAENSRRAEKKPPTYEISPKIILNNGGVNLIFGISAAILSYIRQGPEYLVIYFGLLFVLFFGELWKYFCIESLDDVSSEIFHPDLLPKNDFVSLRKRYNTLSMNKSKYEAGGKVFPEKYQTLYENLKPIYEAQVDLRRRCWFTIMVGAPVADKNNVEKSIISGVDPIVEEAPSASDSQNSDNNSESDTKSPNDDSSESEYGSEAFEMSENGLYNDDIRIMKFDEKISHMQNEIDQLKIQCIEMKTENSKLKNFIETFITSQACV